MGSSGLHLGSSGLYYKIPKIVAYLSLLRWSHALHSDQFDAIPASEPVITFPDKVVKEMSTDTSLTYQLLLAITTSVLTPELANMLCGNNCHSRLLTTGELLMMLWMSYHGLTAVLLRRLQVIVHFVCQVYLPMCYEIQVQLSPLKSEHLLISL